MAEDNEHRASSIARSILLSVQTGLACFVFTFVWRALIYVLDGRHSDAFERRVPSLPKLTDVGVPNDLALVIGSPIIETVGMVIVLGVVAGLTSPSNIQRTTMIFAWSCFGLSWLIHGANLAALGQAFAFLLLARLASHLQPVHGWAAAFGYVAFAHSIWNVSVFAAFQFVSWLNGAQACPLSLDSRAADCV